MSNYKFIPTLKQREDYEAVIQRQIDNKIHVVKLLTNLANAMGELSREWDSFDPATKDMMECLYPKGWQSLDYMTQEVDHWIGGVNHTPDFYQVHYVSNDGDAVHTYVDYATLAYAERQIKAVALDSGFTVMPLEIWGL